MSATVWTAPAAVAAGVLVVAGIAKVGRPDGTARALAGSGIKAGPGIVRLLALAEVGTGAWALVAGGTLANVAVAGSYAAFTLWLAGAARAGRPVSSCGCFGQPDVPATRIHVVLDAAFALAGGGAAAFSAPGPLTVAGDQPWAGVPFALLLVLGVALAVGALTLLPRVAAQ